MSTLTRQLAVALERCSLILWCHYPMLKRVSDAITIFNSKAAIFWILWCHLPMLNGVFYWNIYFNPRAAITVVILHWCNGRFLALLLLSLPLSWQLLQPYLPVLDSKGTPEYSVLILNIPAPELSIVSMLRWYVPLLHWKIPLSAKNSRRSSKLHSIRTY